MCLMIQNALHQSKQYLKEIVRPGDRVIDATAGNGHDTLFLAKLVGETGQVLAFDIQEQAIASTKKRLQEADVISWCQVILDSHANLEKYIESPIRAVVFNLGYLPGAEHEVTTESTSTWQAIETALKWLEPGGRIVIVIYHGHVSGKLERQALLNQVSTLPQEEVQVFHSAFLNQKNSPPELLVIEKKSR